MLAFNEPITNADPPTVPTNWQVQGELGPKVVDSIEIGIGGTLRILGSTFLVTDDFANFNGPPPTYSAASGAIVAAGQYPLRP